MELTNNQSSNNFPYLENLNPEQRKAVETLDGALLVLAGAGTGKTKVLTTRVAHLLKTGKSYPGEILAVTFTNKAAFEMKNRVAAMVSGQTIDGWWMGTFHSISARILRRHAQLVGLEHNFTILDEDDQLRLLKQVMDEGGIDVKRWPPRMILSLLQKWKDKGQTPETTIDDSGHIADGKMLPIYKEYQSRLKTLNACDFGDLLLHILTIFRDPAHRDILEQYQNRFKYILVDEYQDTNASQYLWLRLLAQKHKNICCVGDDDQSIYGWRGAEIGNILKFERDFDNAQIIRLEQNYRSTQNILKVANKLISHNQNRLGKELWSNKESDDKIRLQGVWDGMQEAAHVTAKIEDMQRKGIPLNEMAVLVRASHQTRSFEEKFIKEGIPHKVLAGMRFYERQEIRDAIAYLRIIAQPNDDMAFERIVNVPKRGIGSATIIKIRQVAREKNISFNSALELILQTDELKGKTKTTLQEIVDRFKRWRGLQRDISHIELAQLALEESGYLEMWRMDKSPEAHGRLENLKEFINALNEFENLETFLEHVSLVMDSDANTDGAQVTIMTYHAAKGLEYDVVIMPGWEEGLFPNQRALDESGIDGLEEERRLAYVGITRARKHAFIYFAANRLTYGNWNSSLPSRFINELPMELIDPVSETGVYNNTQQSHKSAYQGHSAQLIESTSFNIESSNGFSEGERVLHKKFGYGTVVTVEGDKLDVRFDKEGRKKLLDSFVSKAE